MRTSHPVTIVSPEFSIAGEIVEVSRWSDHGARIIKVAVQGGWVFSFRESASDGGWKDDKGDIFEIEPA